MIRLISFLSLFTLTFCSKDTRIVGGWFLEEYESSEIKTIDNQTSNIHYQYIYSIVGMAKDEPPEIAIKDSCGVHSDWSCDFRILIQKDGTFLKDSSGVKTSGYWSWMNSAKKKSAIRLDSDSSVWKVTKLKNFKLILEKYVKVSGVNFLFENSVKMTFVNVGRKNLFK